MTRVRPTATPKESAEWLARVALDWRGEEAPEAGRAFTLPLHVLTVSVSRSGMSRKVRVFMPVPAYDLPGRTPRIADLSWHVAALLGMTLSERDELTLSGCGLDLHEWLAHAVERELRGFYPNASVTKSTL